MKIKLRKIFKKFILPYLFLFLDSIIPKKKNLLIFAAHRGERFCDNSKHLFLKFLKFYKNEFEIIWISAKKDVYKKVAKEVGNVHSIYLYSLGGLWKLARSRVIFFTHGTGDIPYFKFSFRKKLVLLWHAISFKMTGLLDPKMKKKDKRKWQRETNRYSFIISSSDIDRYVKSCCFGVSVEKIKITGLPRNDMLYESLKDKSLISKYKFLEGKIILYAPTYRREGEAKFFPFPDFDPFFLNTFLEEKNAYILLRSHYHENIPNEKLPLIKRIYYTDWEKFEDVQEILLITDILITDYSSIFLDFLILNRPIIFIPYDKENFFKNRKLLYEYEIITPGPKIKTQKELIFWIEKFLTNKEEYQKEREIIRSLFHKFSDGCSYKRIYNLIKKEINSP